MFHGARFVHISAPFICFYSTYCYVLFTMHKEKPSKKVLGHVSIYIRIDYIYLNLIIIPVTTPFMLRNIATNTTMYF